MHRRPALAVLGLTATAVLLSACTGASTPTDVTVAPVAAASPTSTESPDAAASPSAPAVSPTLEPSAAPPSASPAPASPAPGSPAAAPAATYDVAAAQRVLADGGYYAGAVDGRPGPAMRSAVMAFQKVNGLGADGTVGPATLKALAAPKAPVLKGSAPADRVEVDLTKQVLYVVKGGKVARIMPVSSGNGATYAQKSGGTARALTPVGHYKIERRIVGERHADLGTLYDPQYFYRGWAIHGSNSVPAGPASHGCVRVTRPDAKYLLDLIGNGTAVYLYGGKHVFTAGSAAPGTSNPTGDTAADAKPEPTVAPAPTKAPAATKAPAPTVAPAPTKAPTVAPAPTKAPTPTKAPVPTRAPAPTSAPPAPAASPVATASTAASPPASPAPPPAP